MDVGTTAISLIDLLGKVLLALETVENLTFGAPLELHRVRKEVKKSQETLSSFEKHCEGISKRAQGYNSTIIGIAREVKALQFFLSQTVTVPRWYFGITSQSSILGSESAASKKLTPSVEHIQHLALQATGLESEDKPQLKLSELIAFIASRTAPTTMAAKHDISTTTNRNERSAQNNRSHKQTIKREPDQHPLDQQPLHKHPRGPMEAPQHSPNSNTRQSSNDSYSRQRETRSMSKRRATLNQRSDSQNESQSEYAMRNVPIGEDARNSRGTGRRGSVDQASCDTFELDHELRQQLDLISRESDDLSIDLDMLEGKIRFVSNELRQFQGCSRYTVLE